MVVTGLTIFFALVKMHNRSIFEILWDCLVLPYKLEEWMKLLHLRWMASEPGACHWISDV